MEFMFYLVCFVLALILLFLLTWFTPPDSPWSFWWQTNRQVSQEIAKLAHISEKDIVYELGSGTGTFLITVVKEFGARAVGIEIDKSRVWYSKLMIFLNRIPQKKITILEKDFNEVSLSNATVLYLYLVPRVLTKLLPKLKKELKKGTRIVSYKYTVNLPLVAKDETSELYLYKI